jgi:GNAT superfamily N-acetyltransferase
MAEVLVKPVTTRQEKKLFLGFPWELYRNDPNWIPPLRGNQRELVNYRPHPFYERNQIQTFLAWRGGKVCGRIAAVINCGHVDQFHEQRGFFGFFECIDDQAVANGLLDAARHWLAERGFDKIRGPANPSLNYEVGTLIEGFDSPPTFMMTYNPPYYQRLLETYGLVKAQDLYAYWGSVEMLPKSQAKLAPVAQQIIERLNIRLRPLDRTRYLEDVQTFLGLFNESLANTWGFVPMTPAEVEHTAVGLRYLMVPELSLAAEIDGKVVGAVFGLPDYNPRVRQIDGRLFPFGFIRLLRNKQAIKKIRLIATNVVPEYQRWGVGLALLQGLVPKAMEWGMQEAEFSWVLESNLLSRGSLEKGGAKRIKTYRLFDLDGPPAKS